MPSEFTNDFFKWLYVSEIEHKDRLDSGDGLLAGVLTVLSGVSIYYLKILPLKASGYSFYAFWVLAALYGLSFFCAVYSLVLSIWPRDRAVISSPSEFRQYVAGYQEFHSYYHPELDIVDDHVDEDLQKLLQTQFAEAAQHNRDLILAKAKWQVRTKIASAAAIALLFLNAYPMYVVQREHSETQKVDLIELPNDRDSLIIESKEKLADEEPVQSGPAAGPGPIRKPKPAARPGLEAWQGRPPKADEPEDPRIPGRNGSDEQKTEIDSPKQETRPMPDQSGTRPPELPQAGTPKPNPPEKPVEPQITMIKGGEDRSGQSGSGGKDAKDE